MNAVDQPASRTAPDAAPSGHLEEGLTMIDVVWMRLSPSVYNDLADVDRFVEALS